METPNFKNETLPKEEEPARSPELIFEQAEQPKTFEEFRDKEDGAIAKFIKGTGQKLSQAALALSLFMGASSAYGEDIEKGERATKENKGGPTIIETETKKAATVAPEKMSEWDKLFNNVSLSFGGVYENKKVFEGEVVNDVYRTANLAKSDFYKGFTEEQETKVRGVIRGIIETSANADEYFKALRTLHENEGGGGEMLDRMQKMLLLQRLGLELYRTYNEDMLSKNEHVEVSDDKMFGALKLIFAENKAVPVGICGNISSFVAKAASSLGYEAWLQSTTRIGGPHILNGVVADGDKGKEIVFLDSANMIRTGTLNYRDALGILERSTNRVAVFNSFVETAEGKMLQIKSRANKVIEESAGLVEPQEALDTELGAGAIKKNIDGMNIALGTETKSLSLTKNHIGVSFSNYENTFANPYQPLSSLDSARVGANFAGEHLGVDANVAYLHISLKDLQGGKVNYDSIIPSVFASYLDELNLTKGEYGDLSVRLGASLKAAMSIPLHAENVSLPASTGAVPISTESRVSLNTSVGEAAAGARLIYIDPSQKGKFFVGASMMKRNQANNLQAQKMNFTSTAERFNIGAEVEVREGAILGVDASSTREEWGNKLEVGAKVKNTDMGLELTYGKDKSNEERFVPSATKVGAAFSYTGNPKYEFRIMGFRNSKQYKDAKKPFNELEVRVAVVVKVF